MSGWISLTGFKETFSKTTVIEFINDIEYPFLFGDSVSNIVTNNNKGVVSFRVAEGRPSKSRTPLNYIFPIVNEKVDNETSSLSIGSSSNNHFILPDYTVSDHHALIIKRGHNYFLKDLASEFGSYVNSVSFGRKEVLLNDGDSVSIGRYQFFFFHSRTLFDHVYDAPRDEWNDEEFTEELTIEKQQRNATLRNNLRKDLNSSSEHATKCISSGTFPDFDERLLTIISFVPFFNAFTNHEKRQIVSFHNKFVSAKRDDVIIRENEKSNDFYIVLKGRVEVVRSDHAAPLNSLGPSSSFGEVAFLLGSPRYASVVAREPTILFRIDRDFFENIGIEIRDKLKSQIIRQLSSITHRHNILIQDMAKEKSEELRVFGKGTIPPIELDKKDAVSVVTRHLDNSPAFSGFSRFEKNSLVISISSVKRYLNGETVLREGILNDGIYYIIDGSVYVTGAESGLVLSELGHGKFFGEMSSFGKSLVTANIISMNKSTIMKISVEDFQAIPLETREKLRDMILKQIIDRQSSQNLQRLKYSE
ncbi:MAG: cyclic nucleotide-binding domain-containing protein [Magnetococcales bacterium]|nr:cyclic nucleotide-binding domain-containing protein [Magnetococcales bacterium]